MTFGGLIQKTMRKTVIFLIVIAVVAVISVFIPGETGKYIIHQCPFFALAPLIISLLSTAGQLGAESAANQKAGIERKRYENQLQGRIDDLNEWFNTENSKDFLTTDIAQSSIRGLLGQTDRQAQALNNAAASGGATQEANIAAKGKLNENFADAIGRLLGYGTNYKQGLRQQYDYRLQSLYQPMDQLSQSKIQDYANFSNNVANAGNSVSLAAGMIDWEEMLGKSGGYTGWDNYGDLVPASTWGIGGGSSTGN